MNININMFFLLGGFGYFGCLIAFQHYKIDIDTTKGNARNRGSDIPPSRWESEEEAHQKSTIKFIGI